MGAQVGDEHVMMLGAVGVHSSMNVWAAQYGSVGCHADEEIHMAGERRGSR